MTLVETLRRRFAARFPIRPLFVLSVLLPSALVFAYTVRYHEPWRDEIQALLIGRDVSLSEFVRAFRLEGVPPLYHLLLKVFCLVFSAPVALALASALGYAILLGGTLHLLHVLSRRVLGSVLVMLVLAGTNTYAYELGVVSRPYGIGLGFVLAGIGEIIVARRLHSSRRALRGALLCGLAALTSAHAACVAGAALAAYAVLEMVCRRSLRPIIPTFAALPFFGVTWYMIAPYPERTAEAAAAVNPTLDGAWQNIALFLESGALVRGWWIDPRALSASSWPVYRMFALAMFLIAVMWVFDKRHRSILYFALGTVALTWTTLLYIFVAWYSGGARHHLFLWMPAVTIALGRLLSIRPWRLRRNLVPAVTLFLLAPWLVFQYSFGWENFAGDFRGPFSGTKRLATILPQNAHVVSDHDYSIVGLHLWRGDLTLSSPDGLGRRFNHLVVDRVWHNRTGLGNVLRNACTTAPDRTMLARNSMAIGSLNNCLRLIERGQALLVTEKSDLYRVDCSCLR